jgi:hypothetical protein
MARLADLSISSSLGEPSLDAKVPAASSASQSSVPQNVLFPALPASSIMDKQQRLSVLETFHGKNVLITGGTGFLGKVIVEKLLRCVPNVGKIFLLVRAQRHHTALCPSVH